MTMKQRVLQLIGSFQSGGSERQALQLAGLLKQGGRFDVEIASLDASGPLGAEAHRLGLVSEVAPAGEHLAVARRLADEIAANAPLAVGIAKRLIDLGEHAGKHDFLEIELWAQSLLKGTDDAREGARAAMERRPPKFIGR